MPGKPANQVSLGFAYIRLLRPDVAEVTVAQGIEFTGEMVDRLHAWLRTHTPPSRKLLINKINDYSYSFEAQHKLVAMTEVDAIAVIVRHERSREAIEMLTSLAEQPVELRVFTDRDSALLWLGLA